jgi:hypothetical protein
MVDLEILKASEYGDEEWQCLARLRVDGVDVRVEGDERSIDFGMPVASLRTGERLRFEDDREEWARSLQTAFRTGDVIVRVLHDDNPLRAEELHTAEVERHRVQLRERLGQPA